MVSSVHIRDLYFFIVLVLLFAIIIIQFVFDRSAMRFNHRCPDCNKKTDIPIERGETINLNCPSCNIICDLQEVPSDS
jgi:hypothetical protein